MNRATLALVAVSAAAAALLNWRFLPGDATDAERPPRTGDGQEQCDVLPVGAGELAGHNLLLITLDTTRADRIGCYGNQQIGTPTLDRLAAEGVLFSAATAVAPTTLPAHSSIFTGLYPAHHGVRCNGIFRLEGNRITLAEQLQDAGFQTGAVVSSFVLDSQFGLDQGFDRYLDDLSDADDPLDRLYRSRVADRTTDRAIAWLREAAQDRFFLWVHYFDPHNDYIPPEPFAEQYAHNLYDGEIAFVDSELARLLAALEELGLSERCLTVVVGDHGEGLGFHGEYTHAFLTYESTLHVPLLLHFGTPLPGGVRDDRPVSQVDIMPTVLSLLGIDSTVAGDGEALTGSVGKTRPVYFETLAGTMEYGWEPLLGVRTGSRKYIHSSQAELYELARDPDEARNLAAAEPAAAARMKDLLGALFGPELEQVADVTPTVAPSAGDLESLQALGYLGGGGASAGRSAAGRLPQKLLVLLNRVENAQDQSLTHEQTEALLRELLQEHPDFYPAWFALGRSYRRSGALESAAEALARCVQLRPDAPQCAYTLALVKWTQGQTTEALRLLEPVVQNYPDYVHGRYLYGSILGQLGRLGEAADHLKAAFQIAPEHERCLQHLVSALTKTGQSAELRRLLDAHLRQDPGAVQTRLALVSLLQRAGDFKAAHALLRQGLLAAPGETRIINRLAQLLGSCPDPAVRDLQQAIALLAPFADTGAEDPALMLTLCQLYAGSGRLADALALAARARSLALAAGNQNLVDAVDRQLQRLEPGAAAPTDR